MDGEDNSNGSCEACECCYEDNISPTPDTMQAKNASWEPNVVEFFCTYCGRNGTQLFPPELNPSIYLRKASVCPSCSSSFEKILYFQYAYYGGGEEYVPENLCAVQSAYHYYRQSTAQPFVPVEIQNVYGGALQYSPYVPNSYQIVCDGSAMSPQLQYTTDVCGAYDNSTQLPQLEYTTDVCGAYDNSTQLPQLQYTTDVYGAYGNSTQFPLPQDSYAPLQQNVVNDNEGVSGGVVQLALESAGQLPRGTNPPSVEVATLAAEQLPLGQNPASVQATLRVHNENYSSKNLANARRGAGPRRFYSAVGYSRPRISAASKENRTSVNGSSLAGVSDVKYNPKNKTEISKNYKKKNAVRHFANGAEDGPPAPAVSKENSTPAPAVSKQKRTPANRDSQISGLSDVEPSRGCKTKVADTSRVAHASEKHKSRVNRPRLYSSKPCYNHKYNGFCNYGTRCHFRHD